MITTIIAVYGAVVATASTVLGAWYFLRSGPRLQAEAYIFPEADENGHEQNEDTLILLRVWNSGRAEITVDVPDVSIHYANDPVPTMVPLAGSDLLDGSEVPVRILGHSGESWSIELQSVALRRQSVSATLSVILMVGGNREVDVPVLDGLRRKNSRPLILKPASS